MFAHGLVILTQLTHIARISINMIETFHKVLLIQ